MTEPATFEDGSRGSAMTTLSQLLEGNRKWAARVVQERPGFFEALVAQQAPGYLWIGCSDSRVPANEILGLLPGEVFVHRNLANMVHQTDLNCLSVLQYAVEFLRVRHIIVCGHYCCGGVKAAMESHPHGLVDNWLRGIHGVYRKYRPVLDALPDSETCLRALCEYNVREQVLNTGRTTVLQNAWCEGRPIAIHGWIYELADGILKDLECSLHSQGDLDALETAV